MAVNTLKKDKTRLFIATVESVLLYGAEMWTIAQTMKNQLDGCYTRMLRMALNPAGDQGRKSAQMHLPLL